MAHISELEGQKRQNFLNWLTNRGAEIFEPTNEYEVVRFRTANGVSIIYRKAGGKLTFTGEAEEAYLAYRNNISWRAVERTKRKAKPQLATLRARDGDLCFYCQEHVEDNDASEEHLVSLTHGGPNHLSNKFLAHKICNLRVGNISATEKVKIHVTAVLRKAADNLKAHYVNN